MNIVGMDRTMPFKRLLGVTMRTERGLADIALHQPRERASSGSSSSRGGGGGGGGRRMAAVILGKGETRRKSYRLAGSTAVLESLRSRSGWEHLS